ncbi:MAG: DUF2232 domain-containing protein [Firmicutes bacterium]|nr:DUF2232 domain-containing protein [Bacillota bacterium]
MISLQPRLSDSAPKDVVIATLAAAILALAGIKYMPGLGMILWTLPISLIIIKRSCWSGMLVLALTALVVSGVSEPAAAAAFMAQFALVGLFFGIGLKRRWRLGTVITVGIIISILTFLSMELAALYSQGISLNEAVKPSEEIYNRTMEMYQRAGLLDNIQGEGINQEEFAAITRQLVDTLRRLVPSFMAIGAIATAVFNFLLLHLLGQRLRLDIVELPRFMDWQLPWYLTYGVILGLAALLGGNYLHPAVKLFGENLLMLFAPVLVVFGTSVAVFFYQKAPWPMWLKIGLVVLGFVYIWFTLMMLMALGLFDPLFGYRKRFS